MRLKRFRKTTFTFAAVPWVQQAQWYYAAPESSPQLGN